MCVATTARFPVRAAQMASGVRYASDLPTPGPRLDHEAAFAFERLADCDRHLMLRLSILVAVASGERAVRAEQCSSGIADVACGRRCVADVRRCPRSGYLAGGSRGNRGLGRSHHGTRSVGLHPAAPHHVVEKIDERSGRLRRDASHLVLRRFREGSSGTHEHPEEIAGGERITERAVWPLVRDPEPAAEQGQAVALERREQDPREVESVEDEPRAEQLREQRSEKEEVERSAVSDERGIAAEGFEPFRRLERRRCARTSASVSPQSRWIASGIGICGSTMTCS